MADSPSDKGRELQPCPCCGAAPTFNRCDDEQSVNFAGQWIECTGCGLSTTLMVPIMDAVEGQLAELWNRRFAPPPKAPLGETPRTKREFYDRVVAELNLDTRDPFTNLLANACALVDQRDQLERGLAVASDEISRLERELVAAPSAKVPQSVVDEIIERAEQACRYVWKHQEMEPGEYAQGFENACGICEKAIRASVMQHLAEDIKNGFARTERGPT